MLSGVGLWGRARAAPVRAARRRGFILRDERGLEERTGAKDCSWDGCEGGCSINLN